MRELTAAFAGALATGLTGLAVLHAARPPEHPTGPERFRAAMAEVRGNELRRELIEAQRINAALRAELDAVRRRGGEPMLPGGVDVRDEDRIPPAGVLPGK